MALDPERAGLTSCTGDLAHTPNIWLPLSPAVDLISLRADVSVCGSPKQLDPKSGIFQNHRKVLVEQCL